MTEARIKRILIIGDSVSFPRQPFGQKIEECWPMLLKQRLSSYDIWVRSQPAVMIHSVIEEFNIFSESLHLFDYVIFQAGINDSCPRPMPYWLHLFFVWLGNQRIRKLINRNYVTLYNFYCKTWTKPSKYRSEVGGMLKRAEELSPETKFIFIPILPACKSLMRKAPQEPECIAKYNDILRDLSVNSGNGVFLESFAEVITEDWILQDGHHLNETGHEALADHLSRYIQDSKRTRPSAEYASDFSSKMN